MIKIAGLAALGIAGAQSVHAQMSSTMDHSKPWSISAALRGFYDDNYATLSDKLRGPNGEKLKRDSFGFEVTPSAQYNIIMEQTTLGLSYVYGVRYYEDRVKDKADQSHQANIKLSHAFTTRFKLDAHDSFVSAQEPTVLDPAALTSFLRSEGDNIRNNAGISLAAGLSEEFEIVGSYDNWIYDYDQHGAIAFNGGLIPSRSALLDRVEHVISINPRYQLLPATVVHVGYTFTSVNYRSNEALNPGAPLASQVRSKVRDNYKHDIFAGVDQTFSPKLNGSLRLGAEIIDYRSTKGIVGAPEDNTGPYVDGRLTYAYAVNDTAMVGINHRFTQTDVAFTGGTSPVLAAESTTVYGQISHHLTAKISASLLAQYQHSEYQGGNVDGKGDDFFTIGLTGNYEINRWLSAEAGYNYDMLSSDLKSFGLFREYDRNRVFIGVRATY